MAKKSAVEKNNKRKRIVAARGARRAALKAIIADKNVSMEDRFQAVLKLADEPPIVQKFVFVTGVRFQAVHVVMTVNLECLVLPFVIWPQWVRFRAL